MLRGNVLSYAYNATIYSLATAESTRARAAEALGRSGNPLAIEQLVQALTDASPRVRRSAARALGESGAESAAEPLVRELLGRSFGYPQRSGRGTWPPRATHQHRSLGRRP